ncbi:hypothetical protein A9Q83_07335 [Alphaproteobacteria bacterium 46_93_T64]|nr:hypothetical protein A9Q83_07335 [Alphaproteobacteria bacterium 46_93_T64]
MQAGLTEFTSMSPMMMMMMIAVGPVVDITQIIIGSYQVTPLKQLCLRQCHSPDSFLMTQWQNGRAGAPGNGKRTLLVLCRLLLGVDGIAMRHW